MRETTNQEAVTMKKFKLHSTYQTRSIGDADCTITMKVWKRTAKTLWTVDPFNAQIFKSFRIFIDYNGNEAFKPWGSYSMAPVLTAEKEIF